jgi:hypothetical protein
MLPRQQKILVVEIALQCLEGFELLLDGKTCHGRSPWANPGEWWKWDPRLRMYDFQNSSAIFLLLWKIFYSFRIA